MTRSTYLRKTPLGQRKAGGLKPLRRDAISASLISTSSLRLGMSKWMMSPSRTAAMGPPTKASGATWPAVKPRVAPEKRPSVSSATWALSSALRRDGRGDLQHLAHAGPALGAFIANDEHVAGLDLAGLHGGKAGLFGIEDARRAAMLVAIGGGDLHHAAFGGEIAFENHQAAVGLDGLFEGVDDDLAGSLFGERGFFSERLAADGERGAVGVAGVDEALGEQARAAGGLIVRGDIFAGRREVADVGRALADDVEVVDGKRNAHFARDGEQMQHGVGGTAAGGDAGDGVLDRFAGDDLRRAAIGADGIHQNAAGFARGGVLVFAMWRERRRAEWARCRESRRSWPWCWR